MSLIRAFVFAILVSICFFIKPSIINKSLNKPSEEVKKEVLQSNSDENIEKDNVIEKIDQLNIDKNDKSDKKIDENNDPIAEIEDPLSLSDRINTKKIQKLLNSLEIKYEFVDQNMYSQGLLNIAQYRIDLDIIRFSKLKNFRNQKHYNLVALHEIIHATGAVDRLDRDLLIDPYIEEVIAQKGAEILGGILGFEIEDVRRINHYLKRSAPKYRRLNSNEKEIVRLEIKKSINYVLELLRDDEMNTDNNKTDHLSVLLSNKSFLEV